MLCRGCDATEQQDAPEEQGESREESTPIPDQLCSRCGHLIGADDVVRRVRKKESQLARFGLSGPRRALLKRREDR